MYQAVANGKLYLYLNPGQDSLMKQWGTRKSWEGMKAKIEADWKNKVYVRHLTFGNNEFQFWSDNNFGSA